MHKTLLDGADISSAILRKAKMRGANLSGADLSYTDLRSAHLKNADLSDATLTGADLRDATLTGADLSNADLSWARLTDAKGWTEEQLKAAESLEFATMPNGQDYEDWLNRRREGGENGGPS